MFVPCTALLYDSTAATWTLKLSTPFEHFLWNPSDLSSDDVLSCLWIVFTNSVFQLPPQKIVRWAEILGIGWPGVIGLMQNESVSWEVMSEVFKCVHLNTSGTTSHETNLFRVKLTTPGHPISEDIIRKEIR